MFFLYLILWIVLNGAVTPEILVFGVLIAGAATLLVYKVFGYSLKKELQLLTHVPLLAVFTLVLIREIVKAALSVLKMALFSSEKADPVIVEFHSGLPTDLQNVLLANSITLTPGTYTLFQEGDGFVVHALREDFAEGIESSVFIKLLRRLGPGESGKTGSVG